MWTRKTRRAVQIAACTISNEQHKLNEDDDRIEPNRNVQKQHEKQQIKSLKETKNSRRQTHTYAQRPPPLVGECMSVFNYNRATESVKSAK